MKKIDQSTTTSIIQHQHDVDNIIITTNHQEQAEPIKQEYNQSFNIQNDDLFTVHDQNDNIQTYQGDSFSSIVPFDTFVPFHSKLSNIQHEKLINLDLHHENVDENIQNINIINPNTSIVPQRSDREVLTYFRPTVVQHTVSKDEIVHSKAENSNEPRRSKRTITAPKKYSPPPNVRRTSKK